MPTEEIDLHEARRLSGYSRIHLYNLLLEEKIQSRKLLGRRLIDKASLLAYLIKRERPVNEPTS
jgi:hypothetical protein